jgi:hypothetical protein
VGGGTPARGPPPPPHHYKPQTPPPPPPRIPTMENRRIFLINLQRAVVPHHNLPNSEGRGYAPPPTPPSLYFMF